MSRAKKNEETEHFINEWEVEESLRNVSSSTDCLSTFSSSELVFKKFFKLHLTFDFPDFLIFRTKSNKKSKMEIFAKIVNPF